VTEFELQQLFIATRWEFDIPAMLLVGFSLAFIAVRTSSASLLQGYRTYLYSAAYLFVAGFLFVRAYAAVGRAQKLSALLRSVDPAFEVSNPALQLPTYFFRYGLFTVVIVVTLYLLLRARSGK